jgi:hypothetical protein
MEYAVYEAQEVANPFEQPGLTEEVLLAALEAGHAIRANATALDAPTRGGSEAYFEQVVSLRRELLPHEWTYSNARNFCTVISPDGKHAIAIAQGTKGTGLVNGEPETARALGPTTAEKIEINLAQLDLFESSNREAKEEPLTWFLLSYRDGGRVYSELSLPELRTESGIVYRWRQRWLLSELDPSGPRVRRRDGESEQGADASSASAYIVPISLKG